MIQAEKKYKRICFLTGVFILYSVFLAPHFLFGSSIQPTGSEKNDLILNSDPQLQGNFTTIVIPLKRAQNLLLVEARINGMTGNFILDTGAPRVVLNKTYFRQGKLADGVTSVGLTGTVNAVYHTQIDSLVIQKLSYRDFDADLVDLRHLEDSKGVQILGLLGANLFVQMEIEIDVHNSVLYLHKLNQKGERLDSKADSMGTKQGFVIPVEVLNSIVFLNATAAGKKLHICLDTGAETNVLNYNVPKKVLDEFHLSGRSTLQGMSNQKLEVLGGQLNEIFIGTHKFENMPFILTGLNGLQEVYNTNVDGIIGFDLLSKGRVIINFKKKQLTMYFYEEEVR